MLAVARRAATIAVIAITVVICLVRPASAHEQRQVGGLQLTVGWGHEPAYTGYENAIQVFIKDAKGNPVDDLGTPPTLHLQVVQGSQTSDPMDLKPSFDPDSGHGTHGEFDAAIVPTAPGDYTFHLFGTVNGMKVDEKFTSSDKTFDTVKDPAAIQFPVKTPSAGVLATNLDRLNPRVDRAATRAEAGLAAAATAKDDASKGITVGIGALAVDIILSAWLVFLWRRGSTDAA